MKHKPITMEDLGLTPGEAQILADGSRHLFGTPTSADEAETEAPAAAQPKTGLATHKPALEGLTVKSSGGPGKHPDPKKSKGK